MTLITWKLKLHLSSLPKNYIIRKHLLMGHKTHCIPRKQLPICCLEFFVYGQYEPVDKGKSLWITMA